MRLALVEQDGRVAQVEDASFDVSPSLRWISCPDNVVAGLWEYNGSSFAEIPRYTSIIE
jgi:hypothetical protein